MQIQGRAERRMPGKRQFLVDGKDADSLTLPGFNVRRARQDESRLRKIHLASERLHLLIAKTGSIGKNSERITSERGSRKNIELHEFVSARHLLPSVAVINRSRTRPAQPK